MTVPEVGAMIEPIGRALRETFLSDLFGGEEAKNDTQETLGHRMKSGGIRILEPRRSAKRGHGTSTEICIEMVLSLIKGVGLNCVGRT